MGAEGLQTAGCGLPCILTAGDSLLNTLTGLGWGLRAAWGHGMGV